MAPADHEPLSPREALRPVDLLEESERRFATDVAGAIAANPDSGEVRRRELILQALAAYERLRVRDAPRSDPAAVFDRWPTCVLVATAWLARSADDVGARLSELLGGLSPATWLAGWAAAWERRPELQEHDGLPGVAPLFARSAAGSADLPPPVVRLDVDRGALVVDFGHGQRGVSVLAGGGTCPRTAAGFLIPRPVRIATCTDVLGGVHVVNVVDVRDPLVVFDESGARLPAGAPLPAGEVWILHLGEPGPAAVDGSWHVLELAAPPVGWSRWWLGKVSLTGSAAIRSAVDFGAGPRLGAWRGVAGTEQADLVLGEPVEGLLGPEGEPVHSTPPRLRLPGGTGQTWTIELTCEGSALPRRWMAAGGTVVSLAEGWTGPLVGRFRIAASAPGQGAVRASLTLAQGVELNTKYLLRILERHGGLTRANVRLSAPAGVEVPGTVSLQPHEMRKPVTIRATHSGHVLDAVVELPHCSLRRRVASENGRWGVHPETFTLDDLARGGCLDVRFPPRLREAMGRIPALVTSAADGAAQQIRGSRVADGVYRYRLAEVADAVRADGSLVLSLVLGENITARVARIRGSAVVEDVIRRADGLRLIDRDPAPDLVVRVTSPISPWLPPAECVLSPGEVEVALGPGYAHGGLLDVRVNAPHHPGRTGRTFRIGEMRRVPNSLSGVEFQMAAYLAGTGPLPVSVAALRLLWISADAGGPATDAGGRALVAQECAAALGEHPVAALVSGARTGLAPHRTIGVLIRSGLAAHRLPRVDRPEAIAPLVPTSPLLSLLLSSPLLPYLSGVPSWDPAELTAAESALLRAVREHGSPVGVDILTGARPPDGPPPPAPLVTAVDDPAPDPLPLPDVGASHDVLRAFDANSPLSGALAHVRMAGASLREVSLGCALVARLAAHGYREAVAVELDLRGAWLSVATADPGTAASDLALAEYLVSHWDAHRV